MSAFVVSTKHIDALVNFALNYSPAYTYDTFRYFYNHEWHWIKARANETGQKLLDQNYRSVNYRYNETETAPVYTYRPYTGELNPEKIIKACNCYDYQACETDDYKDTEASAIIDAIRDAAIEKLTENEDTWEITE